MTSEVDVVNDALQRIGTRTTITSLAEQSNEAIQANISFISTRDELLRMAPWNCANAYMTLTYITSLPGTPENQVARQGWGPGLPAPGWAYEYQYPVDCLKALSVIATTPTGSSAGVPITQAITAGGAVGSWRRGPPVAFKVSIDQFFTVISAAPASGGTGYTVGEVITLVGGPAGEPPIGAPAQLFVATEVAGVITAVGVLNHIGGDPDVARSGSYFRKPTNPVAQSFSTGLGTGATFNLTFSSDPRPMDQRVILAQCENAILCYNRQVINPNVMDPLFLDAWSSMLGAKLALALTGDKALANMQIQLANAAILEARKSDGNEGITVIDHVPDWIRTRGIYFPLVTGSPSDVGFDWGGLFPTY